MAKILVVDDSAETLGSLAVWLDMDGYAVVVARDVEEALGLLASEKPDLVITDGKMPGSDGLDLVKSIREEVAPWHQVPIIMLTGYYSELADKAFKAGVNRVFSKPTFPEVILANVKHLLELSS